MFSGRSEWNLTFAWRRSARSQHEVNTLGSLLLLWDTYLNCPLGGSKRSGNNFLIPLHNPLHIHCGYTVDFNDSLHIEQLFNFILIRLLTFHSDKNNFMCYGWRLFWGKKKEKKRLLRFNFTLPLVLLPLESFLLSSLISYFERVNKRSEHRQ